MQIAAKALKVCRQKQDVAAIVLVISSAGLPGTAVTLAAHWDRRGPGPFSPPTCFGAPNSFSVNNRAAYYSLLMAGLSPLGGVFLSQASALSSSFAEFAKLPPEKAPRPYTKLCKLAGRKAHVLSNATFTATGEFANHLRRFANSRRKRAAARSMPSCFLPKGLTTSLTNASILGAQLPCKEHRAEAKPLRRARIKCGARKRRQQALPSCEGSCQNATSLINSGCVRETHNGHRQSR